MAAVMSEVEQDTSRRKAMNHMDPETKLVHARLEEWAKWAKDSGIAGYPRQSLTEKAAQYGKLGIPQESNYRSEPMMPDHVALIDAAICRLGDLDRRVIKAYYLRWQAVAVMAWNLRMRERKFQHILQRARWRIMGYLDASK
jgi:hypothetical protein